MTDTTWLRIHGLNLIDIWFGRIERQAIHRGTFGSVMDLNGRSRAFVHGWMGRVDGQGAVRPAPSDVVPPQVAVVEPE